MTNGFLNIISSLIKSSKSLKEINLTHCNLGEKQVERLKVLLLNCSQLEVIDFSRNEAIGKEMIEICKYLRKSSNTLKSIDFSRCSINSQGLKAIGNLLKSSRNIEIINLSLNNLGGNKNFSSLCNSLKHSKANLKRIYFEECGLYKNDGKTLSNL